MISYTFRGSLYELCIFISSNSYLLAIAEVYKNAGNEEYGQKNFENAIYFYTEGIKTNCKDDELTAKLYSNRATAHFRLGEKFVFDLALAFFGLLVWYIKFACKRITQVNHAVIMKVLFLGWQQIVEWAFNIRKRLIPGSGLILQFSIRPPTDRGQK